MVIRKSSCIINCRSEPEEAGERRQLRVRKGTVSCSTERFIVYLITFLWFVLAEETLTETITGLEHAGVHKHALVQAVTQTQITSQGPTAL